MIKVEVVELCPVYRHGLVSILTDAGMKVLSARAVFDGEVWWQADVVVMGADTIGDQASAVTTPPASGTPVLLLTSAMPDPASRFPGWSMAGSISRDAHIDVVVDAVRTVASGAVPDPGPAVVPTASAGQVARTDSNRLSPRESQVLRRIAHGRTQNQIAQALGISRHTVDTYIRRIRSKLELGNKAELSRAAVLGGYWSLP